MMSRGSIRLKFKSVSVLVLSLFFSLVVIWVQGSLLFPNGTTDSLGNLVFYDYAAFRDSTVHLSLISEIESRFPPTNFAAGAEPLKNYHYFYDTLIAVVAKVTDINRLDLYFRVAPICLSAIFCLLIFLTTLRLTGDRLAACFAIFFSVMATSLGSITPEIKRLIGANPVAGGNNIYMSDQIYNMMINPQGVAGLIIFLLLFLLLNSYDTSRKKTRLVFFTVLLGLSFGFKAYGGLVFLPAALASGIWSLLRRKDALVLLSTLVGGAVMVSWIRFSIDAKVTGISWAPLWLVAKMMIDYDRLNEPGFALLNEHYAEQKSWRLWLIFGQGVVVYLVGSLGLRLLGLKEFVSRLGNYRDLSPSIVFLLSAALVSLSVPLFFNQSKKAFDIVQFTPYFTLVMGVFFTISLFRWLRGKSGLFQGVLVSVFLALFMAMAKPDINQRLNLTSQVISFSPKELEGIDYVKQKTPQEALFLLPITERNREYLWFTSLAGRRTVYSGYRFTDQVGVDTAERENAVNWTFSGKKSLSFDFVYIKKSEGASFATIEDSYGLVRVFENDEVVILRK